MRVGETMSLHAEIVVTARDEMRGAARRIVNFAAFVRESGVVATRLRVQDLSTEGCRLFGPADLSPGAEIWLRISGLAPSRARVAWVRGAEAGCEFASPLHRATVEQLMAPGRRLVKRAFGAIGSRLRGGSLIRPEGHDLSGTLPLRRTSASDAPDRRRGGDARAARSSAPARPRAAES